MIIDIRGTNGSGKSYPIHELLRRYPSEVWNLHLKEVAGEDVEHTVVEELSLAIIGSYRTQCGGADGVTKQDAITAAIKHLHPIYKTVIVEGSIVASVYSRWEQLARELNDDYVFWFLDTPVDECVQSVMDRRLAKGNTKAFKPEQTLMPRHEAIQRLKDRLITAGRRVGTFDRGSICDALIHQIQVNAGVVKYAEDSN